MSISLADFIPPLLALAKEAGKRILSYYRQDTALQTTTKPDNTPVTVADLVGHRVLLEGLQRLSPDWPVLSEEGALPPLSSRRAWTYYWLIDPLDGTRGFIRGCDEYTVNVALVYQHQPVIGVIYAPSLHECYYAVAGGGSYQEVGDGFVRLQTKAMQGLSTRVLLGQFHRSKRLLQWIAAHPEYQILRLNSSLKLVRLASGAGDIYPRLGPTGEWDTAAGQCILEEAGGCIVDLMGKPLHYNARETVVNPAFLAIGDSSQLTSVLNALQLLK